VKFLALWVRHSRRNWISYLSKTAKCLSGKSVNELILFPKCWVWDSLSCYGLSIFRAVMFSIFVARSLRNWSPVHTALEKFENAALFQRLGFPSTITRHENGAFENALRTRGIWKRRLCVFIWTENILKTELFENDDITIVLQFPCPSFTQTHNQNDRWLLRLYIPPTQYGRKTFDAFSEWNLRFQIPPA